MGLKGFNNGSRGPCALRMPPNCGKWSKFDFNMNVDGGAFSGDLIFTEEAHLSPKVSISCLPGRKARCGTTMALRSHKIRISPEICEGLLLVQFDSRRLIRGHITEFLIWMIK